jgi:ribonuclease HII
MEKYFFNQNEIGLDEAGRGPLIGNVYTGAVIWDPELKPPDGLITDSKKLSVKKRKLALEWIKQNIKYYGVGFATNEEIDKINILEATKLAMDRAIDNLKTKAGQQDLNSLIIDGTGWEKKFTNYNVKSIVKGDSKYYSIAAASILAKEYHDEHILELCSKDPSLNEKYCLASNMGYASAKHIQGIKEHGYTNLHRKSFKLKCL